MDEKRWKKRLFQGLDATKIVEFYISCSHESIVKKESTSGKTKTCIAFQWEKHERVISDTSIFFARARAGGFCSIRVFYVTRPGEQIYQSDPIPTRPSLSDWQVDPQIHWFRNFWHHHGSHGPMAYGALMPLSPSHSP